MPPGTDTFPPLIAVFKGRIRSLSIWEWKRRPQFVTWTGLLTPEMIYLIARSAFSLRRDKSKPDDFCPPLLLRIIIDFCEEDLRVGTAQMPDGKTSTKFRRSKEENRLSLNKTYLNVFEVLIWVTKK